MGSFYNLPKTFKIVYQTLSSKTLLLKVILALQYIKTMEVQYFTIEAIHYKSG